MVLPTWVTLCGYYRNVFGKQIKFIIKQMCVLIVYLGGG